MAGKMRVVNYHRFLTVIEERQKLNRREWNKLLTRVANSNRPKLPGIQTDKQPDHWIDRSLASDGHGPDVDGHPEDAD